MTARSFPGDLINREFGLLTVREFLGRDDREYPIYRCQCSCAEGRFVVARRKVLLAGQKQSCGCLVRNRPKGQATRYMAAEIKRTQELMAAEKIPYTIIRHKSGCQRS